MNCLYCGKKIVLVPSAQERARKYGGKPSDYTALFTIHAQCQIEKRNAMTLKFMRSQNK